MKRLKILMKRGGKLQKQISLFLQTVGSLIEFPEDSVQYIIFRESFEFHRSSNYKIEEGGWRK